MAHSPFQLPSELLVSTLCAQFPCRDTQIRSLTTLLFSCSSPPKNIVLHGLEATGKSSITQAILSTSCSDTAIQNAQSIGDGGDVNTKLRYAIVKSAECVTGRHLLETTACEIAKAVDYKGIVGRCESLPQLAVEIMKLLDSQGRAGDAEENNRRKISGENFVLVFDGVDRQKEAQPTLLPALARMAELVPSLTSIFIVTSPRPHFLHMIGVPHIHFPAYTKSEALQILTLDVPPLHSLTPDTSRASSSSLGEDATMYAREGKEVWSRFVSVVWDSLAKHSGRDILSLRDVCMKLWPSFTQPIQEGNYLIKDFSRLIVSKRVLFQDERLLVPSIAAAKTVSSLRTTASASTESKRPSIPVSAHVSNRQSPGIISQLPHTTRLLLVAAYLASYTPSRTDTLLYMKSNAQALARKRKRSRTTSLARPRPGTFRHRRIARKLLGPQAFATERMLAIFWALVHNSDSGSRLLKSVAAASADIPMAIATLASLRLVAKTSPSADALDASTKWKVNVGWDAIRSMARTVGIEVEEYFLEE